MEIERLNNCLCISETYYIRSVIETCSRHNANSVSTTADVVILNNVDENIIYFP